MYTEPPDGRCNSNIATFEIRPSITTDIVQANHSHIHEILKLREIAGQNLKALPRGFIDSHINQFHIAIADDRIVGCCRIFKNYTMYELGSLVSQEKGVGSELIRYAENYANKKSKGIMAITRNSILGIILENRNWTDSDLFPKRLKQSPEGSKLYLHWGS